MGKIHISDDLRNKLDSVLSVKKSDINSSSSPVGPAPRWNNPNLESNKHPPPPPPPPPQNNTTPPPPQQSTPIPDTTPTNSKKKKKKKNKFSYLEYSKIVFITSVIAGVGITFGVKIGNIIFY